VNCVEKKLGCRWGDELEPKKRKTQGGSEGESDDEGPEMPRGIPSECPFATASVRGSLN
jgi:hypothetical protein